MTEPELSSCPFCGSTDISSGESLVSDSEGYGKQTGCNTCGALGPVARVTDEQASGPEGDYMADAAWNRRAPSPSNGEGADLRAPATLPESMSRDQTLKYFSDYANLVAHEVLGYQRQIHELRTALAAATPAPQPAPSGWKLVPVEPTQAMLEAVAPFPAHLSDKYPPGHEWHAQMRAATTADQLAARSTYRAMLAASPHHTDAGAAPDSALGGKGEQR